MITIDRKDLEKKLKRLCKDERNVDPALRLVQPVFDLVEGGFDIPSRNRFSDEEVGEMCTAIGRAHEPLQDVHTTYRYRLSRKRGGISPLTEAKRGVPYSEVISSALNEVEYTFTLKELSPSLDFLIRTEVEQKLFSGLEQLLPPESHAEDLNACTVMARDNLIALLTVYFNLTTDGKLSVIKERVKPSIIILPKMLPLCSLNGDPRIWSVLVG